MTIQASNFEQHTGFAFNSNDFSMHSASGCTLLPMVTSAMMEDWDSEHNEDEDAPKIEIDPDLEDGDDAKNQEILKGLRSVLEDLRGNPTNFKGEF